MKHPHPHEDVEQIILGIGREIYTAIQHKDADSLKQFLADDFVHRSADGTETDRHEFLRGIREMPFEIKSITGHHERVSVYGDVAVMTGVQNAEWRQSETEQGLNSVAFADVFSLRDGKWLLMLAFGAELNS